MNAFQLEEIALIEEEAKTEHSDDLLHDLELMETPPILSGFEEIIQAYRNILNNRNVYWNSRHCNRMPKV